jgi:hypothetical protein
MKKPLAEPSAGHLFASIKSKRRHPLVFTIHLGGQPELLTGVLCNSLLISDFSGIKQMIKAGGNRRFDLFSG